MSVYKNMQMRVVNLKNKFILAETLRQINLIPGLTSSTNLQKIFKTGMLIFKEF